MDNPLEEVDFQIGNLYWPKVYALIARDAKQIMEYVGGRERAIEFLKRHAGEPLIRNRQVLP